MSEQERAMLKAELMQEIRDEMNITKGNADARCFQPVLDKWCNGENRPGYHGRSGALIEALPKYKGWNSWEHIRRLTCNIMNVSYVRDIKDVERAQRIAEKLCETVVELTKEGSVGEWIRCEDRMPEHRGRYLVMIKTDGNIGFEVHEHLIRIMYFGSEGWHLPRHYPEWIHEALKQEVTHWMPLPEPPKEG